MVNMVHVVIVVNIDKLDLQLQLVNFFNSSLRCCLKNGRHFKDSSTFCLNPKHQVDKVKSQVLSQKRNRNKPRTAVANPPRFIRSCDQDAEHKKAPVVVVVVGVGISLILLSGSHRDL